METMCPFFRVTHGSEPNFTRSSRPQQFHLTAGSRTFRAGLLCWHRDGQKSCGDLSAQALTIAMEPDVKRCTGATGIVLACILWVGEDAAPERDRFAGRGTINGLVLADDPATWR